MSWAAPALAVERAPARAPAAPAVDDEPALVERVRHGDPAAFDALAARYMRRAFAVAYRLLGNREDAEDLVQEAFMAVLRKIDGFERGRGFAPWFFRILVNRGLNARKARALRTTDEIPDAAAASANGRSKTSGTSTGSGPRDTTTDTCPPGSRVPSAGSCATTEPAGASS